ncbi:cation:H+ antiporter [Humidesulfovibrio mexicanus]|uniref:Cation:H+ antiporter n=1 Tax=Humidesulfovibrio mexicanus TaxID=147047 RepID=A0A238YBY8_9BACT|nr:sodium:calcium antiporter [Humidesulfovibrio mexicanus]SNR68113.1 cation:H+ antiporter [Humidesulfovibrio mexicanus]
MRKALPLVLAALVTMPGLGLRLSGIHLDAPSMALISGLAILGASFLLLWACDVAQMDIPQTLALAVVALIAVLPEYAVDMYFTWQAGQHPESDYAHYAIANMTGANRLLIGVAWSAIAGLHWFKTRRRVILDVEQRTEVLFLGMATAYAFLIPIKGSLAWYDGVVFLAMYAWYIRLASQRPCSDCELEGPAELIGALPRTRRRQATLLLFLFAAGVILANAEPFSENLVATGKVFGINEFLLVQWLAPIASEAPEFIVAIMFVLRGQAAVAMGSLISSKLNQWTLLVGMIPGVYGVSSGGFEVPLPLGPFQMHEIFLTAAQSLMAVALLASLSLGPRSALLLFCMFAGQLLSPYVVEGLNLPELPWGNGTDGLHQLFSAGYVALFAAIALAKRRDVWELRLGASVEQRIV